MSPADHDHGALLGRALVALDEMEAKLDAAESARHEPIAIVGMGLRLPGSVSDPESFWDLLMSGRDAVTEVPRERWDVDALFDPDPDARGKSYSRWGAFIDDVDRFDPQFFSISPREALTMDPQQRLLLEVAWHALEHAGIVAASLAGTATGVFVGMTGTEYADLALRGGIIDDVDAYFASGVAQSVAAGRLAYLLDLHGPAVAIDTACSSSLFATHMACQALRSGECDTALSAGVNLMLSPSGHIMTSQARMTSFEGRCKTFDASADGYVRGEGCAVLVLKRLRDAISDGNRVLATIRGTHVNQDGRTNGLTAPSAAAQEAVIRGALADASVDPQDVDFVECHGTGTTLGDPIEIRALQAVFGKGRPANRPLAVQSVKTNIGHLEPAAGIAGLCKLVLALQHGELPAHLHLTEPNPYIPWRDIAVEAVRGPQVWPTAAGARRIGGISSFGFSGTNVHMIVEQAPERTPVDMADDSAEPEPVVYTVSARSPDALVQLANAHATRLDEFSADRSGASFRDAAFTANTGRAHFEERVAVIASDAGHAARSLRAAANGETTTDAIRGRVGVPDPDVVMLFTGQGSQAGGMGARLYRTRPAFRKSLDESAAVLRRIAGFDLLDVMANGAGPHGSIHDTRYAQPALFAYEVAMARLWQSWGVEPVAVIGHSIGELAAAHIAGVMALDDALLIVDARARLMQSLPRDGGMAAVFADADTALVAIASAGGPLSVAAFNGPRNTVISGRTDALDRAVAALEASGVRVVRLEVSHAFHSALMEPMLDDFERVVASVNLALPEIDLISNLSGALAADDRLTTTQYWRDHIREPVRFAASVDAAVAAGHRIFLEVGPGSALTAMGRAGDVPPDARFIASCRRVDDELIDLPRAVAAMYAAGARIDWAAYEGQRRHIVTLPGYPHARERFWHPAVDAGGNGASISRGRVATTLLGQEMRSPRLSGRVFETELSGRSPQWLAHHVIYDRPVVPATALLELMRRAGVVTSGAACAIVDVQIEAPLVLGDEAAAVVQTIVDDAGAVEVFSTAGGEWTRHTRGQISIDQHDDLAPRVDVDHRETDHEDPRWSSVDVAAYYDALERGGVAYGAMFRGLQRVNRRDGAVVAALVPCEPDELGAMHPALADACLQALGLAMTGADALDAAESDIYLPVGVEEWRVLGAPFGRGDLTARGTLREPTGGAASGVVIGDLEVVDDSDVVVASFRGVRFRRVTRNSLASSRGDNHDWYYATRWQPVSLTVGPDGGAVEGVWLIVGDAGAANALAGELRGDAATVTVVTNADDGLSLDASVEPPTGVVVILPLGGQTPAEEGAFVAAMASQVAKLSPAPSLTIVTTSAMAVVPGDRGLGYAQAVGWGVGRVASAEHPDAFYRLLDVPTVDSMPTVRAELAADDRREPHVAWREGVRYAPRLARCSELDLLHRPAGPYALQIVEHGRLDGLRLVEQPSLSPGPDEVLIDVRATGLNFRDVLSVLDRYEGEGSTVGSECSGVVVAVGTAVDRVRPGDRVMAVTASSFATTCVAVQEAVTRMPASLTDAEAATIPIAFLTAHYSLQELGRMQAGERVLIHAAAGGVGMAAIQLARRAGAEIYATAGSETKRAALRGLGVRHVYDSRRLDFADEILRDTDGHGVDLVLNSLSGESIERSVAVLASGGRFVEIGIAGTWSREQFRIARPDAEYHVVYLGQTCIDQPHLIAKMLDELAEEFERGDLVPLPLIAFDIRHAVEAFRYMAQARQIGKVVVTASPGWNVEEAGGAWIVSGGLGGLGLAVAAELAAAGAARLVLCSRRLPVEGNLPEVDRLREVCPDVQVVTLDVADAEAVAAIAASATADGTALRGVIHAAGVLDDGLVADLTVERFDAVMHAKIGGATALASIVDCYHADHFILFSAGAALLGAAGQANYVAANTWLDSFASARRAAGLPAQAIAWGPWSGVGMAAGMHGALRRWESQGIVALDPREGRAATRAVVDTGLANAAVLNLRWPTLVHHFSKHGLPPVMSDLARSEQRRTVAQHEPGPSGDLIAELQALEPSQRRAHLGEQLRNQVLRVLGLNAHHPVGQHQGLSDLGMDSLMAVELSNRLAVIVDRSLPSTLAFEHPTLDLLTAHLEDLLADRVVFARDDGARDATEGALDEALQQHRIEQLQAITDDEAELALIEELNRSGY
ncbi:MAG: type I polyketide synthase [Acidimicrobiales bacterium]